MSTRCGAYPQAFPRIAFILTASFSSTALAVRASAPVVAPLIHNGVRYEAPNTYGRTAYLEAWDETSGKQLWKTAVFRNWINPLLEEDVQWVYIESLQIRDGKVLVTDERGRQYSIDAKTGRKPFSVLPWAFLILSLAPLLWLARRFLRMRLNVDRPPNQPVP
jgi:hypothetical protein